MAALTVAAGAACGLSGTHTIELLAADDVAEATDAAGGDAAEDTALVCGVDDACPSERPICEAEAGRCVECVTSEDCDGPTWCDTTRGLCVECVQDSNCTSWDEPHCEVATGRCRQCTIDAHCPAHEPRCEPEQKRCVECLSDLDCQEDKKCDLDTHECVH